MIDLIEQGIEEASLALIQIPGGVERATNRALTRALQKGRSLSVQIVRDGYTIKASAARRDMKAEKYKGQLTVSGYTQKLTNFTVNPRKPSAKRKTPIRVQVRRGSNATISKAFVANAFRDKTVDTDLGVYVRRTAKRRPLDELYGPSVPGMLSNPENRETIETGMSDEFINRLGHETNNILGGITR